MQAAGWMIVYIFVSNCSAVVGINMLKFVANRQGL